MLSKDENIYGTVEAPNSIDEMFDFVMAEYDISIPLADLLFRKPYDILIANVYTGTYVGLDKIADRDCHHLAFQQELIDWQIWIGAGETALPLKLVITYKEDPGQPQYSATINEWNLSPGFSNEIFEFSLPAGAKRVDLKAMLE